ncbi:MAG TPA: RNA polymerase-associated protein RapA [Gammaproteobacteria bacterium]|nr:RNA polymerase-associated protein RapA [Gammaproteobacteria bacterium]
MQEFVIGQRWMSAAELQLGLGMVIEIEHRTVSIVFPATGETRIYARADAPLTRVRFRSGDWIERQDGELLQVIELREANGLIIYDCEDKQGTATRLPEGRLSHFLQLNQPGERLLNAQIDRNKWFRLRCKTREIANRLQQSAVFGLAGCRTSLIAHQMYIAHEVSRRFAPRVLLADEVGLGKTIEAGLILHQQLLLERARRVLIVVPESLVHQWLVEMLRRFNLMFSIYDEARLAVDAPGADDYADDFDAVENPFHAEQLVLCSLEFLAANAQHAAHAREGEWDLLVVDEAHHLQWSPEQPSAEYQLIAGLAEKTAGLLLLTATPEQLGKESHFARLRLLDPDRFSDIDHFLQQELGYRELADQAEALLADPECSDDIDDLLDRHGTGRVLFRNTRHAVKGFPQREVLPAPLSADVNGDPYRHWLGELLCEHRNRKILVITALADTAMQLVDEMKQKHGIRATSFHEGMSLLERDRAAAWFADPDEGAQVLICSEIGSEGRNFQFAHHLVLFDLPLNPDLLEQRIGRLDRIGQNAVIKIHVPYVEGSARQVLFRWYHEGLGAFLKTCPAGHQVYLNTRQELQQHLDDPSLPIDGFILRCHELHQALDLALQQGRDRLLEMNSCRPAIAESLIDESMQRELDFKIFNFMERIYDCFGVNSEIRGRDGWVITPGENMLTQMPGLPEDGMTVTYDRSAALANEDLHYLTWEHPFVRNAMDMILSSEFGNTALIALGYSGVRAGTLLAECHFLMDFSDDAGRHNERYFPITSIRVVVDESGRDHAEHAELELALQQTQRVDSDTAMKIVKARQAELTQMLEFAEQASATRVPGLIAQARDKGRELLGHEVDRLVALQQVNPGVRDEEIEFFTEQLEHFEIALQHARLRLDAVRVIVAM